MRLSLEIKVMCFCYKEKLGKIQPFFCFGTGVSRFEGSYIHFKVAHMMILVVRCLSYCVVLWAWMILILLCYRIYATPYMDTLTWTRIWLALCLWYERSKTEATENGVDFIKKYIHFIAEGVLSNVTYSWRGYRGIDNYDYINIGNERITVRNTRTPTFFLQPGKFLS